MKKILIVFFTCSFLFSCGTFGVIFADNSVSAQTDSSGTPNTAGGAAAAQANQSPGDQGKRADPDASNWDIALLDTAADADYLTGIEKDIILEMNKVRTDPAKYAELYIKPRLKYYNGKNYSEPGQITIQTREGAAAANECIAVLTKTGASGILVPEKGLSMAAKDHVADQGRTGQIGHNGSDRSTPETRVKRYGAFAGSWTMGENIAYGPSTGREIVCDLLVDDGVPDRGHRENIMNKAFTQTGAALGTHSQYRYSCTITYANGYRSN